LGLPCSLEVGDLDKALEFLWCIFDFKLRGKSDHNAFIDMGDQFVQLALARPRARDKRHSFRRCDRERCAGSGKLSKEHQRASQLSRPLGQRIEVVPTTTSSSPRHLTCLKGWAAVTSKKLQRHRGAQKERMAPEAKLLAPLRTLFSSRAIPGEIVFNLIGLNAPQLCC